MDVSHSETIGCRFLERVFRKSSREKIFVFLFYCTVSGNYVDESDMDCHAYPLGNKMYRYKFVESRMVNRFYWHVRLHFSPWVYFNMIALGSELCRYQGVFYCGRGEWKDPDQDKNTVDELHSNGLDTGC